jgi:heme-degrading monooxygenase HmoA
MFSRVTLLEIDAVRVGIDDAVRVFREGVLPGLRAQDGYRGALVLATPEGKGVIVSLWATEEAATAAAELASEAIERHTTMFRAPPGREHYEVVVYDLPDSTADGI